MDELYEIAETFDASTIAPLPIAVAFDKLPAETSASDPNAVLKEPVVLVCKATKPIPVLSVPVVLETNAPHPPIAVLSKPVELLKSASPPTAVPYSNDYYDQYAIYFVKKYYRVEEAIKLYQKATTRSMLLKIIGRNNWLGIVSKGTEFTKINYQGTIGYISSSYPLK